MTERELKKREQIMISLQNEGGAEVYKVLDIYRANKQATWKQLFLQAVTHQMLVDNYDLKEIEKVTKYFGGKK